MAKYIKHMMNIRHGEEKEVHQVFTESQVEIIELEDKPIKRLASITLDLRANDNLQSPTPTSQGWCIT